MFQVVQSLTSFAEFEKCSIDGAIFRLHYSFTVIALLAFFVISTTRQFVGDPIDCVYDKKTIPANVMNTYCWTHATYTVPYTKNNSVTGHPGIGTETDEKNFRYHTYYQWVSFVLLLQAGLFYAPRWLWLQWEGEKVKTLAEDLRIAVLSREEKNTKVGVVLDYILITWNQHNWYARSYIICEALTVLNVMAQFGFLGLFFEENFLTLGFRVVRYSWNKDGVPPLYQLFPSVTMCKFNMYGQSAVVEVIAALCIMPLNIVNEKVYIFLWFWFFILGVLTVISLAIDIAVLVFPEIRLQVMRRWFTFVDRECVEELCKKGGYGDWLLLYLLGRNMDFVVYKTVMEELCTRLNEERRKEV